MTEMNNQDNGADMMKDVKIAAGIGLGAFVAAWGVAFGGGMPTAATIIAGAGWVGMAARLVMSAKKNAENEETNNQALKDKGDDILAKISKDDNTTLENKVAQKRPKNVTLG